MRQVDRIEVKRCFVLSERARKLANKQGNEFVKGLDTIEKIIVSLKENELDDEIRRIWPPRLNKYNELVWYYGKCSIDDMGVWRCARGLPREWTLGSVREAARYVEQAIEQGKLRGDASIAILGIMKLSDVIAERRLLSLILVPGGPRWGREYCRKMRWNVDDGSMRAIALALTGRTTLNAFVGKQPTA